MSTPLQNRRKTLALSSVGGLLLLAISVILFNVIANWFFVRWDMTASGAYSLSKSSKHLMHDLDDNIVIKVYFSSDLPDPYSTYSRYVRDMLTEYRSASHGHIQFEFMPTNPTATFEKQATDAGMLPVQLEQMGSDQLQIRRAFMGLAIFYRDRSEIMPVIRDIQGLEYDLTSRIARMVVKSKKQILLTSGHGEIDWRHNPNSKLAKDLSLLYDMNELPLTAPTTAPVTADVLFVVGPKSKFDDKSLWVIDQALMRGIPIAFMVDAKNVMINRFSAYPLDSGLRDLLKTYGVHLGDRLVYDAQSEPVGITQNVGGFAFTSSIQYPFIPMISHFEPQPILRGLETVALPFPTTVEPMSPLPAGLQFTPLLYSTDKSWLSPLELYNVSPTSIPQPLPDEPHGPYSLGGVVDGTFTSYFQGKPVPIPGQVLIGTSPKTQIFVLGTSHVLDSGLPEFPGVEAFVSNVMAYMAHDDTLIGIRSKGEIIRPLDPVTSNAKRDVIKLFCVLGVACLPAFYGLVRWRRREAWRQHITAEFAPLAPAPSAPLP